MSHAESSLAEIPLNVHLWHLSRARVLLWGLAVTDWWTKDSKSQPLNQYFNTKLPLSWHFLGMQIFHLKLHSHSIPLGCDKKMPKGSWDNEQKKHWTWHNWKEWSGFNWPITHKTYFHCPFTVACRKFCLENKDEKLIATSLSDACSSQV